MTIMTAFLPHLDTAAIGAPITRVGVSLFPIYLPGRPHLGPTVTTVTTGPGAPVEISERPDATVPTLVATNRADVPVLLVEGQIVEGGRQNRVLNVSVVVPARGSIDIPVSCVEQGRWHAHGDFGQGRSFATRRVRRATEAGVARSHRLSGDRHAAQGMVWSTIHHELSRLGVDHATGSATAGDVRLQRPVPDARVRDDRPDDGVRFEQIRHAVDELVRRGPLPEQCGVVVAHGSRVVSIECFASADLLAAHWPALVGSIMLDAPERRVGSPSATRALQFVRRVGARRATVSPGVGLGLEHHVQSSSVVGQAVVVDDVLLHASAFALAA
ncbi:MAG: ARPP-1 family domain-containing protein [Ilumatobacteraceae bacterium]